MMSLPAMSLGSTWILREQKGRDRGRWVGAPEGMSASGLVFRSDLVGTGRAISILLGINGARNKRFHLVGPPFPEL